MKKQIHTFGIMIMFLIGIQQVSGQLNQNKLLVTLSEEAIQSIRSDENKINSSNTSIMSMINNNNVTSIEQAFPASRKEELLNVYEITCDCNVNDIIEYTTKSTEHFTNPEIVPEINTMIEPNDYNKVFHDDYALDIINAKGAWNISTGSNRINIGITDSNYDLNHEELVGEYVYYKEGLNSSNINHGTAVAICAAGATNNEEGKSSIGYNSSLMLYGMGYNSMLEASYNGAHIINASWGGCSYIPYYQSIIDEIIENGSVIVAAAGNGTTCGGPTSLVYPAAYNGVIAVSSIGPYDNHERIEGDAETTHQHNEKVDLVAPGYDVPLSLSNNVYTTGNGTSFAAPIVSGTIGLMLDVNEELNHCEIAYILKNTAENIDSLNPNYAGMLGAGRLDAKRAVEMAKEFKITSFSYEEMYYEPSAYDGLSINVDSELDINDYTTEFLGFIAQTDTFVAMNYEIIVEYSSGCITKKEFIVSKEINSLGLLPIELTHFDAKSNDRNIDIEWETKTETNNDFFTVEKSLDGMDWKVIDIVDGAGTSVVDLFYEIKDNEPVAGVQYYRLKQTDYDGSFEYSDIVSVNYTYKIDRNVSVYPNPSSINATITWTPKGEVKGTVYDQMGRLKSEFVASDRYSLNTDGLSNGIYYINLLFNDGTVETEKWIVRK